MITIRRASGRPCSRPQPPDEGYLEAQLSFAADHPWFEVVRLDAASHFPMFEVPDVIAGQLREFVAGAPAGSRCAVTKTPIGRQTSAGVQLPPCGEPPRLGL